MAGGLIRLQLYLFVIKGKIAVFVIIGRHSLDVWVLLQTHARMVVRQDILVTVQHFELLERAHKKVGRVVLVRTDLLDDAKFHLLAAFVDRSFLKELSARNLPFELLQFLTVVYKEVTQVLGKLWPTDDDRICRKFLVDRLYNCRCSMLTV